MDTKKLKDLVTRSPLRVAEIAQALEMDRSTYYRKLRADGDSFTVAQAGRLARLLELSSLEAAEIFLTDNSHLCELSGGDRLG